MAAAAILRYALRPLSGPPLVLMLVVSAVGMLAGAAGWLGLPLGAVLASWVWCYTYLLVDYTARGLPPPVLTIEMTAPWHEPRPLLQALALAGVAYLVWSLRQGGNVGGAIAVAVLALASFPASLAVLAVEGHLGRAVWPPALFAIARGLGLSYLLLIAIICGVAALFVAVAPHLPSLLLLACLQFALYAVATCIGGALYEHRLELGLDAWESPEREAEKADAGTARLRARQIDAIYASVRAGNSAEALQTLSHALGPPPTDPEAYRWFRDRAAAWEDRRMAERLTAELVGRLLILGRRTEALGEVEAWWQQGGRFAARTARDLDVLKSVATELGHGESSVRLANEGAAAAAEAKRKPDGEPS